MKIHDMNAFLGVIDLSHLSFAPSTLFLSPMSHVYPVITLYMSPPYHSHVMVFVQPALNSCLT